MKKRLLPILFLCLSLLLAACGAASGSAGSTNAQASPAATSVASSVAASPSASEEPKKEPVHLVWYGYNTPEKDHDMVMAELNKYLTEKINVEIEANLLAGDDYKTKVPIVLSSGQTVDVVFSASFTNYYVGLAASGMLEPLDDLLAQHAPKTLALYDASIWDGTRINGKIYGIPSYKDLAAAYYIYFNLVLAVKHAIDLSQVKTYADAEAALKIIKEKEPAIIPTSITRDYMWQLLPFDSMTGMREIPVVFLNEGGDGKVFNGMEHPAFLEMAKKLHAWAKAGYITPDAAVKESYATEFNAGQVFASFLQTTPGDSVTVEAANGFKLVEKPIREPIIGTGAATGSNQCIPVNSQHKVEAMQFLDLLATDAYVNNLLRIDTFFTRLPEGMTAKDSPYSIGRSWSFGNMMLTLLEKGQPADKWKQLTEFNKSAKLSPSFGFSFNPEAVATEIAACKAVWNEFLPALLTGAVEPESYTAKAIDKMKVAGLDTIMVEAQKQYDAYLAAKK